MSRMAISLIVLAVFLVQVVSGAGSTLEVNNLGIRAATTPLSVAVAFGLPIFLILYKQEPFRPGAESVVRLRRKVAACVLDIWLAMSIAVPLAAFAMLIYVWLTDGIIQWAVQSEDPSALDYVVATALSLITFAGIASFYIAHWRAARQTPGQYILGYQVRPEAGAAPRSTAVLLKSALGFVVWPITLILAARRADRRFFWQVSSGLEAIPSAK